MRSGNWYQLNNMYKRECEHGEMLHWKTCPECREYFVLDDIRGRIDCIQESAPGRESDEYDQGLTDMKIQILAIFK